MWFFPIKWKNDVSIIFPKFNVEKLFQKHIISFNSDNKGEFIHFRSFFEDNEISHLISPPHNPEHNATAERRHRYIVEKGITLLHNANSLLNFGPMPLRQQPTWLVAYLQEF